MIQVRDVTKSHRMGETIVPVLHGITCQIPAGAFTFVLGPSGSGKSTLLYLMGSLDDPDSGEIEIDGRSISRMTNAEKDILRRDQIGFIFQSFNLLSNLDAVDNVLVPYLPTGQAASRRPEAVELLKRVGLGNRLDHRPDQLSGGEQQRVAIARALLKKPALVLADEPTGELDSANGAEIFRLLRELQAEQGSTVVTVTHDHRYLQESDVVLQLRDGRLAPNGA